MTEQKEIADVVLDTPEPDRWVDCGESRPLPMFHMHTLMQYGERCAEAALAWLRSQGEPVGYTATAGRRSFRIGGASVRLTNGGKTRRFATRSTGSVGAGISHNA